MVAIYRMLLCDCGLFFFDVIFSLAAKACIFSTSILARTPHCLTFSRARSSNHGRFSILVLFTAFTACGSGSLFVLQDFLLFIALLATVFRVVFLLKASSVCASSSFRYALDTLVFFILKHHIRNRIVQNTIIPLTYSMLSVVMVAPVALFHFLFQATKRDRIHYVSACVFVALSQGVHRTRTG